MRSRAGPQGEDATEHGWEEPRADTTRCIPNASAAMRRCSCLTHMGDAAMGHAAAESRASCGVEPVDALVDDAVPPQPTPQARTQGGICGQQSRVELCQAAHRSSLLAVCYSRHTRLPLCGAGLVLTVPAARPTGAHPAGLWHNSV